MNGHRQQLQRRRFKKPREVGRRHSPSPLTSFTIELRIFGDHRQRRRRCCRRRREGKAVARSGGPFQPNDAEERVLIYTTIRASPPPPPPPLPIGFIAIFAYDATGWTGGCGTEINSGNVLGFGAETPTHSFSQKKPWLEFLHDTWYFSSSRVVYANNQWNNEHNSKITKGASIIDICKIFGFFDPLPLVLTRNILIYKIHTTSLTTSASAFPRPPSPPSPINLAPSGISSAALWRDLSRPPLPSPITENIAACHAKPAEIRYPPPDRASKTAHLALTD